MDSALASHSSARTSTIRSAVSSDARNDVVITNAYVMTISHGNLKKGSVYIKDGKIAAFGETVNAPASAVDAGGKYLTPGIIDSHSHIALDDDVNEATSPVTPQMMMLGAFDYQDKAIYRALAGGVTTSLILHGSANMIGGQAIVTSTSMASTATPCSFPARRAPSSLPAARIPSASTAYNWRHGC
jgi:imidazolonepropionase-like amidohydrolase